MKTPFRLTIAAAGLALVAAFVVQARPRPRADAEAAAPQSAAGGGSQRVVAEGRLATYPGAEVVISSEVAGTLVRLPVEEQQHVVRGQLVAELRADDLRAELAEARARVVESDAEVRHAELGLERASELLAKKVDTVARRDVAERDLDVARARSAAARAAVTRLEAELAKRRVTAPIAGTVIARAVDPGETVEARVPIVTIADLSRVRVEAEVDEFDAGHVHAGDRVEVTAEGYDATSWRGTVEEIPSTVSGRRLKPQDPGKPEDTRVLIVKVRLDEPTPLKLGQRVEVTIGG